MFAPADKSAPAKGPAECGESDVLGYGAHTYDPSSLPVFRDQENPCGRGLRRRSREASPMGSCYRTGCPTGRSGNCLDQGRPTGTDQSSEPYDLTASHIEVDWSHASSNPEMLELKRSPVWLGRRRPSSQSTTIPGSGHQLRETG